MNAAAGTSHGKSACQYDESSLIFPKKEPHQSSSKLAAKSAEHHDVEPPGLAWAEGVIWESVTVLSASHGPKHGVHLEEQKQLLKSRLSQEPDCTFWLTKVFGRSTRPISMYNLLTFSRSTRGSRVKSVTQLSRGGVRGDETNLASQLVRSRDHRTLPVRCVCGLLPVLGS